MTKKKTTTTTRSTRSMKAEATKAAKTKAAKRAVKRRFEMPAFLRPELEPVAAPVAAAPVPSDSTAFPSNWVQRNVRLGDLALSLATVGSQAATDWISSRDKIKQTCDRLRHWSLDVGMHFLQYVRARHGETYESIAIVWAKNRDVIMVILPSDADRVAHCVVVPSRWVPAMCDGCQTLAAKAMINVRVPTTSKELQAN